MQNVGIEARTYSPDLGYREARSDIQSPYDRYNSRYPLESPSYYPPYIPKDREGNVLSNSLSYFRLAHRIPQPDPGLDAEQRRKGESIEEKRRQEREKEREDAEKDLGYYSSRARDPRGRDPYAIGDPRLDWMDPAQGRTDYKPFGAEYSYAERDPYGQPRPWGERMNPYSPTPRERESSLREPPKRPF